MYTSQAVCQLALILLLFSPVILGDIPYGSGDGDDSLDDADPPPDLETDSSEEIVDPIDYDDDEEDFFTVDPDAPIEIAFSFDTTGSMYPVLERVRNVLADMITRLQSDIPGIRLAVLAHGDYQDARNTYDVESTDFTTDADQLVRFVRSVRRTGGGDLPECYEYALRKSQEDLSWTPGSQRSLVMIGDASPHEPNYPANQLRINWRTEATTLRQMRVRVYAIKALAYNTESFYREVARRTRGYYLQLDNFDSIFDFIMAISYRESGYEFLQAYENEVRSRDGGISSELAQLFATLKQQPVVRRSSNTTASNDTDTSSEEPEPTPKPGHEYNKETDVYELHIRSEISYRFASTSVECHIANRQDTPQEATFYLTMPKSAFITSFAMKIDGVSYPGEVQEKEHARRTYQAAVDRGESAAQVIAAPRNTNSFKVSVNVAASNKVEFTLNYQELLERRVGVYEHLIHVDPGQIVDTFTIDVNIDESRVIRSLTVPPLRNDLLSFTPDAADSHATITRPTTRSARIHYSPSVADQQAASEQGVRGQFIVQYDLEPITNEIKVVDGYFIHFYAPPNLPVANKNVMFILDTSGSMRGTKIQQLKDAMTAILDQLGTNDNFNILSFSSFMRSWQSEGLVQSTAENIQNAKTWVSAMFAAGGTNINTALERGMELLNAHVTGNTESTATSLIMFLTDGQPTDGVTNKHTILDNAKNTNAGRFTLFTLGFGESVDFPFLQQMALQNDGFARRIYADSDADLQLRGFYSEIASPVLSDVNVTYLNDIVNMTTLTETTQSVYFNGTEVVICGILRSDLDDSVQTLHSKVAAKGIQGDIEFFKQVPIQEEIENEVDVGGDENEEGDGGGEGEGDNDEAEAEANLASGEQLREHFRRMWAYLTIKKLLRDAETSTVRDEKIEPKSRALELSLEYNFVTKLTSMVVTRPDEEQDVQDLVDSDRTENDGDSVVAERTEPASPEVARRGSGGISSHSFDLDSMPSMGERGRYSESDDPPLFARPMARPDDVMISSVPARRRPSFADSDPHFLVWVEGSETPVCFDLMGQPGESYQLIADPSINLAVNGFLVGNQQTTDAKQKTYFGEIAIATERTKLTINSEGIFVRNKPFKWRVNSTHTSGDVSYHVVARHRILVMVSNVHLVVMRHKVRPNMGKIDFLGIYVDDGSGFSDNVTGLIGQFERLRVRVDDKITVGGKTHASLTFPTAPRREPVTVYEGSRRNLATKVHVPCWFARNNGLNLIEGTPADYLVPYLGYDQLAPGLSERKQAEPVHDERKQQKKPSLWRRLFG